MGEKGLNSSLRLFLYRLLDVGDAGSTVETILPRGGVLGTSTTGVVGLDNVNINADDTRNEFGDFERETFLNFAMKAGGSGGTVESIFR